MVVSEKSLLKDIVIKQMICMKQSYDGNDSQGMSQELK